MGSLANIGPAAAAPAVPVPMAIITFGTKFIFARLLFLLLREFYYFLNALLYWESLASLYLMSTAYLYCNWKYIGV